MAEPNFDKDIKTVIQPKIVVTKSVDTRVSSKRNIAISQSEIGINIAKYAILNKQLAKFASEKDEPELQSYLNTPVYGSVVFGEEEELQKNRYINLIGEEKAFIPLRIVECIVNVNAQKRVVKTMIQGRNGSIKEYIGDDDYQISIQGLISGNHFNTKNIKAYNNFPEQYLKDFVDICSIGYSIPVRNVLLNRVFKITNLVIENFRVTPEPGKSTSIPFEISAVSDNIIRLDITENELRSLKSAKEILGYV